MKIKTTFLFALFAAAAFAQKLVVEEQVDVYTTLAREPMLAVHPNGTLFATGYRNASLEPQLWKSEDDGKNWSVVDVGTIDDGADGNSDADLVIDQNGVIYFLTMKYTRIPEDTTGFDYATMQGEHIAIGVSKDLGEHWTWTYLSKNPFDDRPWVAISSSNTAHVIWNDGKGVHHSSSSDQGDTWQPHPLISEKGGSSHMATGPDQQLAVRVTPLSASGFQYDEGVDLIRLSLDDGKSWQDVAVPGTRDWSATFGEGTPRWVEPLAWDINGNLYALWSEGTRLMLARSTDNGSRWTSWLVEENAHMQYYPYLTVQHNLIACSWISGFGENLRHRAAVIQVTDEDIRVFGLDPLMLNIWSGFGNNGYSLATAGEYFPIQQLSEDQFGMVTTIQNEEKDQLGFTWWRLMLK